MGWRDPSLADRVIIDTLPGYTFIKRDEYPELENTNRAVHYVVRTDQDVIFHRLYCLITATECVKSPRMFIFNTLFLRCDHWWMHSRPTHTHCGVFMSGYVVCVYFVQKVAVCLRTVETAGYFLSSWYFRHPEQRNDVWLGRAACSWSLRVSPFTRNCGFWGLSASDIGKRDQWSAHFPSLRHCENTLWTIWAN